MCTPPHFDERSIFSYPPSVYQPTAKEIASNKNNINNITDDEEIKNKCLNVIDCPSEIHCTLPDGIKVENHPTANGDANWGLYATKPFPQHSVVFITKPSIYIHDKNVNYKLIIDPNGPTIILNSIRHSCNVAKGVQEFLTYGALINHSCDANCCLDTKYPGLKDNERLAVIALRNIQADEEITLDYNLFGYDMPGFINLCYCHMPSCRGNVSGFKYFSELEKEKMLPYATLTVQLAHWLDKQK
jgi:hypothetical protein